MTTRHGLDRPLGRLLGALLAVAIVLGLAPVAAAAPRSNPRVINGTDLVAGDFPFLVALADPNRMSTASGFDAQFCGGALLNPYTVVTAAHCVSDEQRRVSAASNIEILFGSSLQAAPGSGVMVTHVQVHPDYDPKSMDNDIAVLTLASPIGTGTITPLSPQEAGALVAGTPVRAAGWGRTSVSQETYPDGAKVATLTVLPDAMCGDDGEYTLNGIDFTGFSADDAHASTMICAGGVDGNGSIIDTCVGDSGGPLVMGSGADARLVGIVSWGDECASNYPGVYTRVSAMQPFLLAAGALAPTAAPVPGGIRSAKARKGGAIAFVVGQSVQAATDVVTCTPVGGSGARTGAVRNGSAIVTGLKARAYACREIVTNSLGSAQSKPVKVTARR